ncbi:EamA family transporter [Pelagicoccus albus]|uniref:EamA family transporter n=1 Tax=Pelagicoccus albus TaxID=415222 RepID=A0A7X1B6M7_9BACT|nr:EamA family transporter [Pelagicoccus albus]MBC2606631.1 EamA family transporter [Pelagicoccus albus]
MKTTQDKPSLWMLGIAFAALYIIWGSTYLGIKVAIETIPPFFMSAARFTVAGAILYLIARVTGAARPSGAQWKNAFTVGAFLIAGGNGTVCYAELHIDSSMAALIIASSPLFMTFMGWLGGVQKKPTLNTWAIVSGGLAGVATLVFSGASVEMQGALWGYVLMFAAIIFWTYGSIFSKRNPQTINPWLQSGMQMFCGGIVSLVAGLFLKETGQLDLAAISIESWLAFAYLVVVGSLLGFTSYVFLLRHCSPSTVSSHAYVNPVVALFLGWVLLGETLTWGGWVGSGMILLSVFFLLQENRKSRPVKA